MDIMIQIKKDQNGFVSIMIASVLMVIMALITLGFTRLVQNEQRQAIDNQLSRQAFYAAESGINIAASSPGFPGDKKETCSVEDYGGGIISTEEPDVVFTCILIDPTPKDLVFSNDSITTNKSKVVPIKTNGPPGTITFQWKDINNTNVIANCTTIPAFDVDATAWNKISPLKLDIIAIPTGSFGRNNLIDTQFSAVFTPCAGITATNVTYDSARNAGRIGRIIPVRCQIVGEYSCQVTITGVPANQNEFYARFNAIYGEINVRITADEAVTGEQLLFSAAQAVVDSTGRANDVFQRLQARVPLYDNYILPSAAVQTLEDICKRYLVQEDRVIDNCGS